MHDVSSITKKTKMLPPISHFEVSEYLGSGYWKDAWKASRKSDNSTWTLKFLNRTDVAYKQSLDRNLSIQEIWLKEGLGGNTTAFTNLAFHYVDMANDGTSFVAEEYIDRFLSNYIDEKGKLDLKEVLSIGSGIANGLFDLHKHIVWQSGKAGETIDQKIGWIHGDLKPDNIGYTTQNIVKISDFGTATAGSKDRDNVGYLYSRAPENFLGPSTMASDVYSASTIIYRLLTGEDFLKNELETDPVNFIKSNYTNKKKWMKLINSKTEEMPSYMRKFFKKTLCHHEDRLKDGEELYNATEKLKHDYVKRSPLSIFSRFLKYALVAAPFIASSVLSSIDSSNTDEQLRLAKEEAEYNRLFVNARDYFMKDQKNVESILVGQKLDAYIEFFGDKRTAAFAYLYPDEAVKLYANTGG